MNNLSLNEEKEYFQLPNYAHCVFTQPRLPPTNLRLLTLSSLSFFQHLHFLSACQHETLFCSYALKVSVVPSQRLRSLFPVVLHMIASLILPLQQTPSWLSRHPWPRPTSSLIAAATRTTGSPFPRRSLPLSITWTCLFIDHSSIQLWNDGRIHLNFPT